jgi:ketosteroid isomerase-like protein
MKILVLTFFIFIACHAWCQTDQKEINEQVWKPFTTSIMNQDVAGFVNVHSKDLIRAERNDKKVYSLDEYQKAMERSWPRWKQSIKKDQSNYIFTLRFTERISNGSLAYEVGYFKNETIRPSGEKEIYYGKFQVALRKEGNIWKILVDSDSNDAGNITEKDFQSALPLE